MNISQEPPAEIFKGTQYLSFFVAEEEYAISILRVKEIIEFGNVTRVPNMAPWIRGVTNVRGSVVPVVDLASKFGLRSTPSVKTTCVVILEVQLEGDPTIMGVVVDSVSQVVDLLPQDVELTPAFGTRVRPDYLLGIARSGSDFVHLVDLDKVLSLKELLGIKAVVEAEEPAVAPERGEGAPSEKSSRA